MEGATGGKPGPVGTGCGLLEGVWVALVWWRGLGVERSLVGAGAALGVVGGGRTSSPTSMASSLSEEASESSLSEGGKTLC